MLEIKNLHAGIDGKEILKGLSLEIGEGETVCMQLAQSKLCFFGPDGARLSPGGQDS